MKDAGDAIASSADRLSGAQSAIGDHARAIEQVAARSSDLAAAFGTVANDVEAATNARAAVGGFNRGSRQVGGIDRFEKCAVVRKRAR